MSISFFNSKKKSNADSDSGFNLDPLHDVYLDNNIKSINDDVDSRFSIINLEKDVNEYMNYRSKYYYYNSKLKKFFIIRRRTYEKKEKLYYYLFINKMKYIEETYKQTNNYTKHIHGANNISFNSNTNLNDNINQNGGDIFG